MADHLRGRDLYGRPLPLLTDAQRESLVERPQNQTIRAYVRTLLEQQWQVLLRRQTFAHVTLVVAIRDGMLQPDLELTTCQRFRAPDPEDH